jgi:hypothetical protein
VLDSARGDVDGGVGEVSEVHFKLVKVGWRRGCRGKGGVFGRGGELVEGEEENSRKIFREKQIMPISWRYDVLDGSPFFFFEVL